MCNGVKNVVLILQNHAIVQWLYIQGEPNVDLGVSLLKMYNSFSP